MFGPEYHKIQTAFKRDERNVIVPGDWTLPEFAYLKDCPWRWTEKIDGTNIRVHWNGTDIKVGGRTDNAQIPTFLIAELAFNPERFAGVFAGSSAVTLYGEGYGPKIQGGHQYRDSPGLILFDVRVGDWWLKPEDVADVAAKLGLDTVPVVGGWTLTDAVDVVRGEAVVSRWPKAEIEGLVGTPAVPLYDRKGDRLIVKLKGKDFADLRRRGGSALQGGEK